MAEGELILYNTEDGAATIGLRAVDGTVWLSQLEMATLFDTSKQNISLHINNILSERELVADSVVKESLTTAADGKLYRIKVYNLDAILAVGYRVRSPRGVQFRRWATTVLGEYRDVSTAKNNLKAEEVEELNRIVVMYLDYAEDQAQRRRPVTMAEWGDKLDAFLSFNDRDVLTHAGHLQMTVAKQLAAERFQAFDASRRAAEALAADEADVAELEAMEKAAKGRQEGRG